MAFLIIQQFQIQVLWLVYKALRKKVNIASKIMGKELKAWI
jgi:hypothetical protein